MVSRSRISNNLPLISVQNVSKKYCRNLRDSLWYGLRDIAGEIFISNKKRAGMLRREEFWALRNISFDLKRGESLAVIGSNGAGKSTLLKLLYGLIRPDAGSITIRGRSGALIELGAGLDPVLSGRENIYIRAALLGLKKSQIEPLINLIIDFAGLHDFIDSPVQFYSSGMTMRLAYAVSAYLKPDVLLVDEVIAVGDISFQRKCIKHMIDYINAGNSLVLVSHQAYHIHSVCQRGILLEKGECTFSGNAIETLDCYFDKKLRKPEISDKPTKDLPTDDDSLVFIENVSVEPAHGGTEIRAQEDVPFPTAMIAYCLSFHDSPVVREILDLVARFFLSEVEGAGVWRYWTRQHQYHRNIPPDLDDIVYISSFLRQQKIDFPDNERLVLANRNECGLFYTWLVPRIISTLEPSYWRVVLREALKPVSLYYFWKLNESSPNDIDCVVNANVLFYLGECEETEPIIEYLIEIVRENREDCCDKWHLNRFTFYYALSRNYFAGVKAFEIMRETVINRILSAANNDGSFGNNMLENALAICALLNFDYQSDQPDKAVRALQTAQQKSGAWQIAPLYYGGPKKYFGWGSEELTTGFCVEALARCLRKQ